MIVQSLPGCLNFGHTVEEALAMAKEAIEGFAECMIARGEEVPVETDDSMICTSLDKQMPKMIASKIDKGPHPAGIK